MCSLRIAGCTPDGVPRRQRLYPAELRNLLMRLALAEAYRPLRSDRVQKEWTEALARDRPDLPREKIERVRVLMEQHIPEATVEDYEALIGQLAHVGPFAALLE